MRGLLAACAKGACGRKGEALEKGLGAAIANCDFEVLPTRGPLSVRVDGDVRPAPVDAWLIVCHRRGRIA